MTDVARDGAARTEAPSALGSRLRYVGPGIVIAVTGVGAGDMVSSLVAGTDFGMVLIWAVILGAILKYFLTEGIGRWYMASGQTILQGWRSLGRVAIWYFVIYLFIVTFVFGAAVTSTAALAVDAAFGGVLPLWAWAALHGVAAFIVVGIGRYGFFELIMKTFAGLKFGIVVLLAILLTPSLGEIALGFVPRIPDGALINVLAIIGGVGGTYSLAAYTYWVRERGWRHSSWIPTMWTDLTFGYALTALFMVSMLIIGAQLLFGTGASISDEEGLLTLVDPLQERFGLVARWAFLIGFWAVATGAMIGAWNGGAHLFADCVRTIREVPDEEAEEYLSEKSLYFRAFLAWMTFPPMILLAFGQPVALVIVYASLGALFLPFLAITLLLLLNSRRVAPEYRNRIVSNIILAVSVLPFVAVGVQEFLGSI
ncbi:MAG: Nramp family divalent metal transporter [Rubrobacteraceae bacterium]|jgi:Mn2+/Fe2+ NRAMP family transporter|nr:Nramp family divalent metal transporter [Rubrobacteraceae bacterium]MDQ5810385.1 Nramp family divalent metal transporter [Actinomycetota bacterium]